MTALFYLLFSLGLITPGNSQSYIPISSSQPIAHQYYTLSYNEDTEQANWVYYKLTADMIVGDTERSSNFRNDPLVTTKSASTKDYTNSGYDRGHLCPAADMKFSEEAMYESFYMSNISPQLPEFNRGIWKELETQVREWAKEKDSLYVVTGPIFDETNIRIGANQVKVPASFYKVLYNPAQQQMIAFILPNQASFLPFQRYTSTVDSLEELTGIDFFSQLPDNLENRLESKIVLAGWFDSPLTTSLTSQKSNRLPLIIFMVLAGILILLIFTRKRK